MFSKTLGIDVEIGELKVKILNISMLLLIGSLDRNVIPFLVWGWVIVDQEMTIKGSMPGNTNGEKGKRIKDSSKKEM